MEFRIVQIEQVQPVEPQPTEALLEERRTLAPEKSPVDGSASAFVAITKLAGRRPSVRMASAIRASALPSPWALEVSRKVNGPERTACKVADARASSTGYPYKLGMLPSGLVPRRFRSPRCHLRRVSCADAKRSSAGNSRPRLCPKSLVTPRLNLVQKNNRPQIATWARRNTPRLA